LTIIGISQNSQWGGDEEQKKGSPVDHYAG